jgi:type I restriction enzyme R subunit
MNPRGLNEQELENTCIGWFQKMGYAYAPANELTAERDSEQEVVLWPRLRRALQRLNPQLNESALQSAIDQLGNQPMSLVAENQALYQKLRFGVKVSASETDPTDSAQQPLHANARLIDFADPQNNEFLLVSQLRIQGRHQVRKPDLVVYINGLPLVVIELKNPSDASTNIWQAYEQLQTYKKDIADLFRWNQALVISDGLSARIGSLTAGSDRFNPWLARAHEDDQPAYAYELQTLVEGFFRQDLLLDYLQHSILFASTEHNLVKKIAGWHQFHGVRSAVASTLIAIKRPAGCQIAEPPALYGLSERVAAIEPESGKAGVFFHTQGSGKSISMVSYASKLARLRLNNPTLLVVTDRNDLDDQLFGEFQTAAQHQVVQTPQQVGSRDHLRQTLTKQQAGGIVFTTIQKFALFDGETAHPLLSDRSNLVVIVDEAHRSQYGLKAKLNAASASYRYGYARHMRDALPNACFLGFTGTPIAQEDKDTQAVFGQTVSVFDTEDAVKNGATVPIYYEARHAKMTLNTAAIAKVNEEVDAEIATAAEAEQETLKAQWTRLERLIGAQPRVDQVAADLVHHFDQRQSNLPGKAMIVAMNRSICVALYNAIVALRPAWHHEALNQGQIKIIMTGSAADPAHLQAHIHSPQDKKNLASRFKNDQDDLKLVIVCDMWLTGFDAPCCHTMYIDKPLKQQNLMQAIARVNRVYHDKPGGLVVDYFGLMHDLKQAYQTYTKKSGDAPLVNVEQVFKILEQKLSVIRNLFETPVKGQCVRYLEALEQPDTDYIVLCAKLIEHLGGLVGHDDISTPAQPKPNTKAKARNGKTRFVDACTALNKAYNLCQTLAEVKVYQKELALYAHLKTMLIKSESVDQVRVAKDRNSKMQRILDSALAFEGVESLAQLAGLDTAKINLLSAEFLKDMAQHPQPNLAVDVLKKLLSDDIKARAKTFLVQSKSYTERLEATLKRYNNNQIETSEVIEALIDLAKSIQSDTQAAQKLNLGTQELAFYQALAANDSACDLMSQATLVELANELTQKIRASTTIDWQHRDSVRAKMRTLVRRLLRRYKYPPDQADAAVKQVLQQAELMAEHLTNT